MTIGILTFYNIANFGANLQAFSTFMYLKKAGHNPIVINYKSKENYKEYLKKVDRPQDRAHADFIKRYIPNQTEICNNPSDLKSIIDKYGIEAMIVGSDAVLQHHPFIARIKAGKRRPIYIVALTEEKLYPNILWGQGYADQLPTAMMSVSSQNSEYNLFSPWLKKKMKEDLQNMRYISVRDTWTQEMVKSITGQTVALTPDPVFAFNQNAGEIIARKQDLLEKYHLPEKYVLISLKQQPLSVALLDGLKQKFLAQGMACVALTMPEGITFKHNFDYEVGAPLPSNDWYGLIKYAQAYIGCNMHPIVTSLHNAIPCVSIDNWGRTNFWGKKIADGSSKVEHIMTEFGVEANHFMISGDNCTVTVEQIIHCVESFPTDSVRKHAEVMYSRYQNMMSEILLSLQK